MTTDIFGVIAIFGSESGLCRTRLDISYLFPGSREQIFRINSFVIKPLLWSYHHFVIITAKPGPPPTERTVGNYVVSA
jgi:hypothetical protein